MPKVLIKSTRTTVETGYMLTESAHLPISGSDHADRHLWPDRQQSIDSKVVSEVATPFDLGAFIDARRAGLHDAEVARQQGAARPSAHVASLDRPLSVRQLRRTVDEDGLLCVGASVQASTLASLSLHTALSQAISGGIFLKIISHTLYGSAGDTLYFRVHADASTLLRVLKEDDRKDREAALNGTNGARSTGGTERFRGQPGDPVYLHYRGHFYPATVEVIDGPDYLVYAPSLPHADDGALESATPDMLIPRVVGAAHAQPEKVS